MSKLDQALAAPHVTPFIDVHVVVDSDVSAQLEELQEALEAARQTVDDRLSAKPKAATIQDQIDAILTQVQDSVITLRVSRMNGTAWAALTSHHPMRPGVPFDAGYGFNFDTVCMIAAGTDVLSVEGDELLPVDAESWDALLARISGHDANKLRDAAFRLNLWGPQQREAELGKASRAAAASAKN